MPGPISNARGAYASRRLAETAAALRELGDRGMTRRFRAGVRLAAKPLVAEVRQAARDQLPKSGGLNEHVASQRITTSTLLSARTAAIRLRMPFIDAQESDSGYIRHPVFASPDKTRKEWTWVRQDIPNAAGWWSKTLQHAGPRVTAELLTIIKATSEEIAHI